MFEIVIELELAFGAELLLPFGTLRVFSAGRQLLWLMRRLPEAVVERVSLPEVAIMFRDEPLAGRLGTSSSNTGIAGDRFAFVDVPEAELAAAAAAAAAANSLFERSKSGDRLVENESSSLSKSLLWVTGRETALARPAVVDP